MTSGAHIDTGKKQSFRDQLEARAKEILRRISANTLYAITSAIDGEISLTFQNIQEQRDLHRSFQNDFSREHFYTYRDLVTQKRETKYRPFRPNSIDQLKMRLDQIDRERRASRAANQDRLERFHSKLLALLTERASVSRHDGHRVSASKA